MLADHASVKNGFVTCVVCTPTRVAEEGGEALRFVRDNMVRKCTTKNLYPLNRLKTCATHLKKWGKKGPPLCP